MRLAWLGLLLVACSSSATVQEPVAPRERDASTPREAAVLSWTCGDDGTRCLCIKYNPDNCGLECPNVFGDDVPYCRPYEECLAFEDGRCVCHFIDPPAPLTGGRPVLACPDDAKSQCAPRGAPCSLEALAKAGQGSCCEGETCDLDATGAFRCREANAEDAPADLACRHAGARWPESALSPHGDVVTTEGTIPVGSVGSSAIGLSPDGHLVGATLHLFRGTGRACDLTITAKADGPDPNVLKITAANVRGFPCGLNRTTDFGSDDPTVLNGKLRVRPQLYCEGRAGALCMSAIFDITIDGGLAAGDGREGLAFVQPFAVEGTACSLFF